MGSCFSFLIVNLANLNIQVEMQCQDFAQISTKLFVISLRYWLYGFAPQHPLSRHPLLSLGLFVTEEAALNVKFKKWRNEEQPQHLHDNFSR